MDIIWTKEELHKIKLFLIRTNFKFDNKYNIITKKEKQNSVSPFPIKNEEFEKEIYRLLYLQDRLEIEKLLESTNNIKIISKTDKDNPLYFGLIHALSRIDNNDSTEIFTIFKEILSQYYKSIYKYISNLTNNIQKNNYINSIKETIEDIKNNPTNCINDFFEKSELLKVLYLARDITNNDIFKPTIELCNKNIIRIIIKELENKIKLFTLQQQNDKKRPIDWYNADKNRKLYGN